MEWKAGAVHFHSGWKITASEVPEEYDDETPVTFTKVWVTRDPDPIGFVMTRKFNTFAEVIEYIERREVDKTVWRIKHGRSYER